MVMIKLHRNLFGEEIIIQGACLLLKEKDNLCFVVVKRTIAGIELGLYLRNG